MLCLDTVLSRKCNCMRWVGRQCCPLLFCVDFFPSEKAATDYNLILSYRFPFVKTHGRITFHNLIRISILYNSHMKRLHWHKMSHKDDFTKISKAIRKGFELNSHSNLLVYQVILLNAWNQNFKQQQPLRKRKHRNAIILLV